MIVEHKDFNPDGLLWPYTGWKGMEGIIKGESIWASHISFLNDVQELNIGLEKIYEGIEQLDLAADAKQKGLDTVRLMSTLGFCVTSFSASFDSLSQWRAYSNGFPGIALGFSQSQLELLGHKSEYESQQETPERAGVK